MVARREAGEAVQGFTADQDWRGLSDLLVAWDQAEVTSHDDKRLFIHGLEVFSDTLFPKDAADIGAVRPYKLLEKLDRLFDHHPEEYGLAALATWLRTGTAWGIRGCGYAEDVGDADWAEITELMRASERYRTLPKARTSPMLAYTALRTAPFTVKSGEEMKALWGAYADLAPDCGWGNEHFGEWMQPKWFGGAYDFDVVAKQAMVRTHKEVGALAYANMYTGAAFDEPWMIHSVDMGLFAQGIDDMIRIHGRDPSYIGGVFDVLSQLSMKKPPKTFPPEMRAAWYERSEVLNALANSVLRDHLTAICPSIWTMGLEGALDAITQTVRPAFAEGHSFALGDDGLSVVA